MDIEKVPEIAVKEREAARNPQLERALQNISVKQKEALYLYYYEEYSIREISQMLHRKESTIQSQLAAARKKIKQYYMDQDFLE